MRRAQREPHPLCSSSTHRQHTNNEGRAAGTPAVGPRGRLQHGRPSQASLLLHQQATWQAVVAGMTSSAACCITLHRQLLLPLLPASSRCPPSPRRQQHQPAVQRPPLTQHSQKLAHNTHRVLP